LRPAHVRDMVQDDANGADRLPAGQGADPPDRHRRFPEGFRPDGFGQVRQGRMQLELIPAPETADSARPTRHAAPVGRTLSAAPTEPRTSTYTPEPSAMSYTIREQLKAELDDIRDQGLYKDERVITSPQSAEITL